MTANRCCTLVAAVFLLLRPQPALAQLKAAPGDWPGWRGPNRNGVSTETGLLKAWPKDGPKLLWKMQGLGTGYSTPSVAAGRLFVLGTEGKTELLIALDVKSGQRLWATPIGATAGGYPGPRCTPTVDGAQVYAISSNGKLVCAEVATGAVRWRKDFRADFGGQPGGWAYTESPLIDGDVLVCTPGGSKATLVALDKMTGSVIWKSSLAAASKANNRNYTRAAYSSVIVAHLAGTKQYIQFVHGGVVGVAAKDGKFLWHYDHPANGTANISTPIAHDDAVFAASGYGVGGGLAKISSTGDEFKAKEAYFVKQLQNQIGGVVLVGDCVYGTGSNSLMCVHFKTGKIFWQNRCVGQGSIVYADGHLYVRGEREGQVALVEATPEGYNEKGRFTQPNRSRERAWPYPVVAGGHLYLRDWDVLLCYDVKANGQ